MKRPDDDAVGSPHRQSDDHVRPEAERRSAWILPIIVVMLALGGVGAWWYLRAKEPPSTRPQAQASRGVPVQATEARAVDVPIYLLGLGTVQAFNTVLVRSRVDGTVTRIAFQEGQMVREGDILATIDQRPYRAALDQVVARKAQNEATLRGNRLDLDRTRQLATRDFASRQQFDQQTATVAAQEAVVQADQAAIDNARTQLDYTTIRSPLSGRLGLRLVDQGNIVRSTDMTGIVEVAQLQPISVLFTAPENQLGAIRDAMRDGEVEVVALGSDARTPIANGALALINNEVDTATGTVRLKATFPNDDGRLWPGLSVNTRLRLRILKGATVVPDVAVMRGQAELFTFVVTGDAQARKQVVKVKEFSEGLAVIEDGIKPGDQVVTAGQSRLTGNTKVEVAPPEPARAADAGPTAAQWQR